MRLVTVDVWDTLLRRRCHPDLIKILAAEWLYERAGLPLAGGERIALLRARQEVEARVARENIKRGLDPEYHISDVYARLIDNDDRLNRLVPEARRSALIAEVIDHEIDLEIEYSYPDTEIKSFLDGFQAEQVLFVSDFYMDADQVTRILRANGVDWIEGGLSSCDHFLNKASGRVFEKVAEMAPGATYHVHIGDNPASDVSVPRSLGIESRLYQPESEHSRRRDVEQRFNRLLSGDIGAALATTTPDPMPDSTPREFGEYCFPLYAAFSEYIHRRAKALGCDTVYFFSREGIFLRQAFEAYQSHGKRHRLATRVLDVSRLATFFPSLRRIETGELMRLWNQYSTQSMAALMDSLGLDLDVYRGCLERHGIEPGEPIQYPWRDERVMSLFADREFLGAMESDHQERRAVILRYLSQQDMENSGNHLIVDVGWRGTIQDNLCHLLPEATLHGVYFGLNAFLNEQPANAHKHTPGPNLNLNQVDMPLLRFVAPLEMLNNARVGSVVGYRETNDGRVVPVHDPDRGEQTVFDDFTTHFQQAVLNRLEAFSPEGAMHLADDAEVGRHFVAHWRKLMVAPPVCFAEAFFRLKHNERFGLGQVVDKGNIPRISLWVLFLSVLIPRRRARLHSFLDRIDWPEGRLRTTSISVGDRLKVRLVLAMFRIRAAVRRRRG